MSECQMCKRLAEVSRQKTEMILEVEDQLRAALAKPTRKEYKRDWMRRHRAEKRNADSRP